MRLLCVNTSRYELKKTVIISASNWLVLINKPLKPLLKRWFLADGSWKDRPPETKRGKGLELWEMSIGMSAECDRILYEGDTFSQSFRRTLQESFSQGAQGYARDLVNALSSWPMKLEEISIPVEISGMVAWRPVRFTSLILVQPWLCVYQTFRVLSSRTKGGSILWTKSWQILSKLNLIYPTHKMGFILSSLNANTTSLKICYNSLRV